MITIIILVCSKKDLHAHDLEWLELLILLYKLCMQCTLKFYSYSFVQYTQGPSINYVVSKSVIFDPLPPPLSSFLLSRVYVVNRLWGYQDDIICGWSLRCLISLECRLINTLNINCQIIILNLLQSCKLKWEKILSIKKKIYWQARFIFLIF